MRQGSEIAAAVCVFSVRRARRDGYWVVALGLAIATLLLLTATAHAATRPPPGVPAYVDQQVSSAHFNVHYTPSGGSAGDRLSTAEANTLLAFGESAYDHYVGQWAYPPPLDDGDGRTDIYV